MVSRLEEALASAIAESGDASDALEGLREEGYSLYLLVREGEDEEAVVGRPQVGRRAAEPEFRIDGRDLRFLKSIGIDPTRRLRRRKSSS